MEREPGFYWLRDRETKRQPNPFIAYWSGDDWQFIGSVFLVREDEEDDFGERTFDRMDLLGKVEAPKT